MLCRHTHHRTRLVFNARKNPLAFDPTRTIGIRRAFINDLNRRFRKLRLAVRDFIDTQDALALKEKRLGLAFNAGPREFEFLTDANKLKAFNDWFKQQVDAGIFSVPPGTDPTKPWTAQYVESAYKKGVINAYVAAKQAELNLDDTQAQFLRNSFNQPEALAKVELLATRTFEALKGVTATMSSQMNTILAQGMIDGRGAADIAREMEQRIGSLTSARALTIARTEIINAHSEGQLDAYEKLGVTELGIKVEWSTAGDERVCPICAEREGKVVTPAQARGIIPIHPNCRCAWIPHIPNALQLLDDD